jgi:hypothetical protein
MFNKPERCERTDFFKFWQFKLQGVTLAIDLGWKCRQRFLWFLKIKNDSCAWLMTVLVDGKTLKKPPLVDSHGTPITITGHLLTSLDLEDMV